MTFALVAAITLVITELIKRVVKKFFPKLGSQRLFVMGVNLLVSIVAILKGMPPDATLTGSAVWDILINAVLASGIFSQIKNGIQGTVDVKTIRTGGSISILFLGALALGESACITVPFKGETELTCTINVKDEQECLICAGDVEFKDAGKRHVEQTMCLTPQTSAGLAPGWLVQI